MANLHGLDKSGRATSDVAQRRAKSWTWHRDSPDWLLRWPRSGPALAAIDAGTDALETALDAERRAMIHANERRLERYRQAATAWTDVWPKLSNEIEGLWLPEAHRIIVQRATGVLPFEASAEAPDNDAR